MSANQSALPERSANGRIRKHWNEVILFACEMPLEANLLIESGSDKER